MVEIRDAISAQLADTWSGQTLMGRILPGSIKNRVGSRFLQKSGPNPDPTRLNYIYT